MKTKKCICDEWKEYVDAHFYKWKEYVDAHFDNPSAPWISKGNHLPMYFGKPIDHCPWCGKRLVETEFSDLDVCIDGGAHCIKYESSKTTAGRPNMMDKVCIKCGKLFDICNG